MKRRTSRAVAKPPGRAQPAQQPRDLQTIFAMVAAGRHVGAYLKATDRDKKCNPWHLVDAYLDFRKLKKGQVPDWLLGMLDLALSELRDAASKRKPIRVPRSSAVRDTMLELLEADLRKPAPGRPTLTLEELHERMGRDIKPRPMTGKAVKEAIGRVRRRVKDTYR